MRNSIFKQSVLLAAFAIFGGCSSTNSNYPTQSKQNAGALTALIGGAAMMSTNTFTLQSNGDVDIRGANVNGRELHLHLAAGSGIGVISLGGGTSNSFAEYQYDTTHWVTDPLGSTGTITVTSKTSSHVTGTFSFTMYLADSNSHANNLAVTNGVFDVEL